MTQSVRTELGDRFVLVELRILRGSVEIIAIIAAYEAISRWKSFTESLDLLARQLSAVMHAATPSLFTSSRAMPSCSQSFLDCL